MLQANTRVDQARRTSRPKMVKSAAYSGEVEASPSSSSLGASENARIPHDTLDGDSQQQGGTRRSHTCPPLLQALTRD
jgi:hypothetical protein